MWNGPCCGTATSIAPKIGRRCWSRWWHAIASQEFQRFFRADAAFANPECMSFWKPRAMSMPSACQPTTFLEREIEPLLTRPVGRPSNAPVVWYARLPVSGGELGPARRVVAKVEWHKGELFPRVGFIVTNLAGAPNGWCGSTTSGHGGTVDQGRQERGEVDAAVLPRLRGQPGAAAAVCPGVQPGQLPAAGWRCPRAVRHWTLTTLREKLIKIGAKVVRHCPVRDLPDGGGGGAAGVVPGHFGRDWRVEVACTFSRMTLPGVNIIRVDGSWRRALPPFKLKLVLKGAIEANRRSGCGKRA